MGKCDYMLVKTAERKFINSYGVNGNVSEFYLGIVCNLGDEHMIIRC